MSLVIFRNYGYNKGRKSYGVATEGRYNYEHGIESGAQFKHVRFLRQTDSKMYEYVRYKPRKNSATARKACGGHDKNQSITVLFISPEKYMKEIICDFKNKIKLN